MKKVMIIDDNPTNLKMMDLVLSKAGFRTDTVVNPKFAIDVIREAKPNLLLLDINMPEINGFQICKLMKKDKELADIPVIFVSTLSDSKYIAGGLAMGAVDYITKPIKADEVIARVSVQMELAKSKNKLQKTNEILQKQITEAQLENSDMQSDLIYSLAQLKNGDENPKHYERIKDFCSYIIKKVVADSPEADKLDDDFVFQMVKKSMS